MSGSHSNRLQCRGSVEDRVAKRYGDIFDRSVPLRVLAGQYLGTYVLYGA